MFPKKYINDESTKLNSLNFSQNLEKKIHKIKIPQNLIPLR